MLEALQFVFSDTLHFVGTCILLVILAIPYIAIIGSKNEKDKR